MSINYKHLLKFILAICIIANLLFITSCSKENANLINAIPMLSIQVDTSQYYLTDSIVCYVTNNSDTGVYIDINDLQLLKLDGTEWVKMYRTDTIREVYVEPIFLEAKETKGITRTAKYANLTAGTYMFYCHTYIPVVGKVDHKIYYDVTGIFDLHDKES